MTAETTTTTVTDTPATRDAWKRSFDAAVVGTDLSVTIQEYNLHGDKATVRDGRKVLYIGNLGDALVWLRANVLAIVLVRRVAKFAKADPAGFAAALVNTVDTHNERTAGVQTEAQRAAWLLNFLANHSNG